MKTTAPDTAPDDEVDTRGPVLHGSERDGAATMTPAALAEAAPSAGVPFGSYAAQPVVAGPAWPLISRQLRNTLPLLAVDCITGAFCLLTAMCCLFLGTGTLVRGVEIPYPVLLLLVLVASLALSGTYPGIGVNPVVELRRLALGVTGFLASVVVLLVLTGHRPLEILYLAAVSYGSLLLSLPLSRSLARRWLAGRQWWGEPVLVLGGGSGGNRLFETLNRQVSRGMRPIAVISELDYPPDDECPVGCRSIEEIPSIVQQHRVSWAFIAERDDQPAAVEAWMRRAKDIPHVVVENNAALPSLWAASSECGRRAALHLGDRILMPWPCAIKRTIDMLASALLLVLTAPVLLAVGVGIKCVSPGPILFKHERFGRYGARFKAWKFRTMVTNADEVLKQHLSEHPAAREEWQLDQKLKSDPRVIPLLGDALRQWSIDELPQLWNVLIGEMSLVGPRPIVRDEIAKYQHEYSVYTRVRPGITGLWQVSGRNNIDYEERVQLDRYYVRNWSPWLDVYILFKTIPAVLFREGAY